ncbi:TPR_REGION domain-containing protein [Caenorhabditis elegans]|uniref:TPR_REGION domain-containing protein n=1 Tax=Caenorhabditis elegans TaxID=6239 RepID=Q7JM90_CAEEL|nr:TPR_REGION domain-containing protein [Caenorhabditis elegans]CAF31472.1 TPR_REGION domain-containing protein [Caenorhabditis elegans]|eukprot:NP_001022020.1 PeRoXisome assembly factor [Caenorhabditis elegans]
MKGVVEGQCGQQNALVGLANTFGTSNQRVAPSNASLLPSSSMGEQMANEFLRQQARTMAPTSFSMKSMQNNLPQASASSSLAANWTKEFQPRQNQLASQWSQQYTSSAPSMESAWRQVQAPSMTSTSSHQPITDAGMWSSEYLDTVDTSLTKSSGTQNWADDFMEQQDNYGMENTWKDAQAFEQRWEEIKRDMEKDESLQSPENYVYQEANPFTTMSDPLMEGDNLMRNGDIGNAMLAYEAAVQKDPQDARAWCKLGLAHAENEKDQLAMQAFQKCLQIDAGNKEALLGLSVSQANEGMENEALHQLDKWMSSYLGSNSTQVTTTPPLYSSFLDSDTFNRVEARFLDAARQQGATPDPDLQNALGVLYNLNRNFARAVDSLKLAISKNPTDARLWNRLGATLANGDHTAEAISAYREALKLYPTYVRARYNLGISCMQLSSYDEALKHFLSALELQKGGNDASGIWTTMRSAAIRTSNVPDNLLRAVERRDLAAVKASLV